MAIDVFDFGLDERRRRRRDAVTLPIEDILDMGTTPPAPSDFDREFDPFASPEAAKVFGEMQGRAQVATRRAGLEEQEAAEAARALAEMLAEGRRPARFDTGIEPAAPALRPAPVPTPAPPGGGLLDDLLVPSEGKSLVGDFFLPPGVSKSGAGGVPAAPTGGVVAGPAEDIFSDPATVPLEQFVKKRFGELQLAPFTQTEEAVMRGRRFDALERARQAARRATVERMAALGHGQSSGTIESALQMVDQRFDQMRDAEEARLLETGIGERQNRLREALAVISILPELSERRLQLGAGALGGAVPDAGSLFGQLSQLAQLGTQREAIGAQRSGDFMKSLGSIIGLVLSNPDILKRLGLGGLFG